jgi:hypothetical protein
MQRYCLSQSVVGGHLLTKYSGKALKYAEEKLEEVAKIFSSFPQKFIIKN